MKTDDQMKYLSENYSILHGLKAVPIGLCLFLVGLWANNVHDPITEFPVLIVIVLVTTIFSLWINRYYKRNFGKVEPVAGYRRVYWITQLVLGIFGLIAFWVDYTFDLPVSFIGLAIASVFLFDKPRVALPLNKFSTIKLAAAICVLLVSISPLLFGKDWWHMIGVHGSILGVAMLAGLLTVIQGVIWHIFLIRTLPTSEASNE